MLSLFLSCVLSASGSLAWAESTDPADGAARWLAGRQRATGDLPTYTGSGVGEIIVALLSGGVTGEPVDKAVAYIARNGEEAARSPAHAGRIVMGLVAAGEDPRSFGRDYVAAIERGYSEATGSYEENVYANALAALGWIAAGDNLPGRAVTYIRAQQCATGGFAWRAGCAGLPDVDTTAATLSALLASGLPASDTTISRARSFLLDVQNDDGGFGLEEGDPTNANSTGLALSAVAGLDEDPERAPWLRSGGGDPVSALLALQHPGGGFRHLATSAEPGDYATVQALPGLAGVASPMPPVDREATAPATSGPQPTVGGPEAGARPVAASTAKPGEEHRAGVVVRQADGRTRNLCIAFEGPSITGEELLRRTGLRTELARSQLGTSVCRIGAEGCESGDCFCRYPSFWGYWTLDPGQDRWRFSEVGAAERTARDGSLDAWVWGKDGKPAPQPTTLDKVCAGKAPVVVASQAPAPAKTGSSAAATAAAFGGLALALGAAGTLAVRRRRGAA